MIINKSKRFIFVHNPKTAGSSIHKALAAYNEVKRPAKTKHETISELQNRTSLRLDEYFVFGFARNPWDRFSSFYHFLKTMPDKFPQIKDIPNINEFAKRIDEPWLKHRYSIRAQNEYFNEQVDFIGRYEELRVGLNIIVKNIGIDINIGHVNKSSEHNYVQLFNNDGRRIIAERYEKDIKDFGYEYESNNT